MLAKSTVTWKRLSQLDTKSALLALTMGRRYGYKDDVPLSIVASLLRALRAGESNDTHAGMGPIRESIGFSKSGQFFCKAH